MISKETQISKGTLKCVDSIARDASVILSVSIIGYNYYGTLDD